MRGLCLILALQTMAAPLVVAQDSPKRIILFIGDGVGASYWTAAKMAADNLAVQQFRIMGLVDTRPHSGNPTWPAPYSLRDTKITDSAAAATAFATGVLTYNGAIGVAPDSTPVKTVLEEAQERGMGTGLVATSRITHATPASFAAHVPSRAQEWEIAKQIAEHDIDVVLGGGRLWFDEAQRPDSMDLLIVIKATHTYVETADELRGLDTDTVMRLFGLVTPNHMPAAADRPVTLAEMTTAALGILHHNPRGFFLMVEGSQPDWRGHGNEPLADVVAEVLDFDRAIGAALAFQARNPETLIVVVADHETGGLALQYEMVITQLDSVAVATSDSGQAMPVADTTFAFVASYTTTQHTPQMIPLFASGPGAEAFGGMIEIWRVGELLLAAVRR